MRTVRRSSRRPGRGRGGEGGHGWQQVSEGRLCWPDMDMNPDTDTDTDTDTDRDTDRAKRERQRKTERETERETEKERERVAHGRRGRCVSDDALFAACN